MEKVAIVLFKRSCDGVNMFNVLKTRANALSITISENLVDSGGLSEWSLRFLWIEGMHCSTNIEQESGPSSTNHGY